MAASSSKHKPQFRVLRYTRAPTKALMRPATRTVMLDCRLKVVAMSPVSVNAYTGKKPLHPAEDEVRLAYLWFMFVCPFKNAFGC